MARKVRTISEVEVVDIGDKGQAIGKCPDGRVVLVEKAVPGDVVDVVVRKKRKGMLLTTPQRYVRYSGQRVEPFCQHFGTCGGCKWQHLDYAAQLQYKEQAVRSALQRIGQLTEPIVEPIAAAPLTTHYRNKLEFTFTDQRWLTQEEIDSGVDADRRGLGFHVPGSYARVLDLSECHLQRSPSDDIRQFVRDYCLQQDLPFQNIRDRTGLMRNLIVRTNALGECMVIVIFVQDAPKARAALMTAIGQRFDEIVSLYYCINPKLNDTYFDLDFHLVDGAPTLTQQLGHLQFALGPKSFFQTNPSQAEVLYETAMEYASLSGEEVVYDLYCGIGTLTLYAASRARYALGIEEVVEAIDDARHNAGLNGITNATFYAGTVRDVLSAEFRARHPAPDVVIADPPRAGMHGTAIRHLLELRPERIVYVSCNPATQARDIALLSEAYSFQRARPVDMFPHTSHIENVALLLKK
ncbi:MAG: 23S rRNA (uracil(1939)-C(5))-methyltransferase RlmD [Saprospiraceae bacterium]|nr:23S rRNA (uracil(1939)-C(5))-methyltransferase RlmD [Saprospiraceae bacterium]